MKTIWFKIICVYNVFYWNVFKNNLFLKIIFVFIENNLVSLEMFLKITLIVFFFVMSYTIRSDLPIK